MKQDTVRTIHYYTSQEGFSRPHFYDADLKDEKGQPVPDYLLARRTLIPLGLLPDVVYYFNTIDGRVAYRHNGTCVVINNLGRLNARFKGDIPEEVKSWSKITMDGTFANGINVVSTSAGWLIGEYRVLPILSQLSTILSEVIFE